MIDQTGLGWVELGAAIKRRRADAGLTLVELARLVELSQPFLSQVENGRAHPSMRSLARIAAALDTTPQALFGRQAHSGVVVQRHTEAPVIMIDAALGSVCRPLVAGDAPFHVMEYDHLSGEYLDWWEHDGFEAALVIRGRVEAQIGDEVIELGAGDVATYDARRPHRHRSIGRTPAHLLLIETAGVHRGEG